MKDYQFFISVGYDGQVLFWDSKKECKTKDLSQEAQFDAIRSITVTNFEGQELGLLNIVLEPSQTTRTFWTATVFSLYFMFLFRKKAKSPKLTGQSKSPTKTAAATTSNLSSLTKSHIFLDIFFRTYRPSIKLERSPFYPELLLNITDYHFTIYQQNSDKPLFRSSYTSESLITCGSFSPSRPGVLLIGRSDGKIDIWDFIDQSNKPSLSVDLQIQTFLSALEYQVRDKEKMKSDQLVAVGDGQGVVRIFTVAKNLRVDVLSGQQVGQTEETVMRDFWKRQKNRQEFSKMRNDIRKKQKQDEEIERMNREEEDQRKEQIETKNEVILILIVKKGNGKSCHGS